MPGQVQVSGAMRCRADSSGIPRGGLGLVRGCKVKREVKIKGEAGEKGGVTEDRQGEEMRKR